MGDEAEIRELVNKLIGVKDALRKTVTELINRLAYVTLNPQTDQKAGKIHPGEKVSQTPLGGELQGVTMQFEEIELLLQNQINHLGI